MRDLNISSSAQGKKGLARTLSEEEIKKRADEFVTLVGDRKREEARRYYNGQPQEVKDFISDRKNGWYYTNFRAASFAC